MKTVQEMIATLSEFWAERGCAVHQGHDVETGAGTFNPATFFRCLGPEPYRAAYVEVSRRPSDGRYGENPNRTQQFHQYQVILKPSPFDVQQVYLDSLRALGMDLKRHDIRFVHDDWEQPTLGAAGLGWEVWRDGMEVTQFTYFQQVANIELDPVTVELTYGLERLALVVQGVDSFWDLKWNDTLTYADIFHASEVEWSRYNFEAADPEMWRRHFEGYEAEAKRLVAADLAIPAYDFVMKASHAFNLLDARGVVSVTERTQFIARIRDLSRLVAKGYLEGRERLGSPLLTRPWPKQARPEAPEKHSLPKTFDPAVAEDLLLEIGSEELPATFVPIGCANLERDLKALLDREELTYQAVEIYGTPRRLAAKVVGLTQGRGATTTERRGPPLKAAFDAEGNPTKAGAGFFRSLGIEPPTRDALEGVTIRDNYLYAEITGEAVSTASILAEKLPALITSLDFPKKMRWGQPDVTYARPLHWIVALHGKAVIPFEVGDVTSGRHSFGHAQLDPKRFDLREANNYLETLRKHKVLADIDERKSSILAQLAQLENESGLQALELGPVLPQVLHLTEWPQLTTSTFDEKFLKAPAEVLISEMVHHQKYFPLASKDDQLVNQFVITADNTPSDEIRHGNVKVLSARLSDGVFLYEQDLKTPLEGFNERLKKVVQRGELGSLYDKAKRLAAYVEILGKFIPTDQLAHAKRAALLSKADLATELVGEFPELQGVIGKRYALAHDEPPEVADAIEEHWRPRGENAPLPSTPAGTLVSLADKFDNLISCFALGLKPTSSSDPYALRRQVLGIVKTLVHDQLAFPLREALEGCASHFFQATGLNPVPNLIEEILSFFAGRIKTVFQDYGLAKDETAASLSHGLSDIYDIHCRVNALHTFRASDSRFPTLLEVYKRAKNILPEERHTLDPALLREPAEKQLYDTLTAVEPIVSTAISSRRYDEAYAQLATFQGPLHALFETVRVMDLDPKLAQNRLALLQRVFSLFSQLLDFSLIV